MISLAADAIADPGVDLDHGALDDVGRRALHRRVDRRPFGGLATLRVARANLVGPQAPAEQGFDVALLLACLRIWSMKRRTPG
jgi:hypothetical protein